ncbi:MAG: hypothetical protein ACREAB_18195 [Blastocatellia bacterium]
MKVHISLAALGVLATLGVLLVLNMNNQPSSSLQSLDEPKPADAFDGIVKAFDKFPIVALAEVHRLQEEADFIAQLIRRPDFSAKVNMIVVEFGNALYQDVIDRYVAGQEVPHTELRQVWRNTTQFFVWDAAIYEQFFANVRAVNQTLPAARRLRVLLGDPPIDWNKVQTREDATPFRDRLAREVVEQEVLTKNRKALIIYGGAHIMRNKGGISLIEQKYPQSMFIVKPYFGFLERNDELEPRLAAWPKPSLALVKGTWLGALDGSLFMRVSMIRVTKEGTRTGPSNPFAGTKLEELVDAYLYLGPSDSLTTSAIPPETYQDEAYVKELKRRYVIAHGRELNPELFKRTQSRKYRDVIGIGAR